MTNQTVYILGAGASHFAGFPLAADLRNAVGWVEASNRIYCSWPIKKETEPKESGKHCLEAVDHIDRTLLNESTDLELTLTLVDLLNLPKNQLCVNSELEEYDLTQVRKVFAQLITETFYDKSLNASRFIYKDDAWNEQQDMQKVMSAWAERIHPQDILV